MSKFSATFVKDLPRAGMRAASAKLWLVGGSYVVSSASTVFGPETYIFPADSEGNITNWLELPGSYQGGLDHNRAIRGYVDHLNDLAAEM